MRLDTDLAMYAYVGGEAKNEPPIFFTKYNKLL